MLLIQTLHVRVINNAENPTSKERINKSCLLDKWNQRRQVLLLENFYHVPTQGKLHTGQNRQ